MGFFQSWVPGTFRIMEQKFILIISAADPRHCSCTSWQWKQHCAITPVWGGGQRKEGFLYAIVVHSILTAMRRFVRICYLDILNSKTASSRGMYPQIIGAVSWHMYWGPVISHGSKSCRAWFVACLWSSMYLLGWLHAVLAQNQSECPLKNCSQHRVKALPLADKDRR